MVEEEHEIQTDLFVYTKNTLHQTYTHIVSLEVKMVEIFFMHLPESFKALIKVNSQRFFVFISACTCIKLTNKTCHYFIFFVFEVE